MFSGSESRNRVEMFTASGRTRAKYDFCLSQERLKNTWGHVRKWRVGDWHPVRQCWQKSRDFSNSSTFYLIFEIIGKGQLSFKWFHSFCFFIIFTRNKIQKRYYFTSYFKFCCIFPKVKIQNLNPKQTLKYVQTVQFAQIITFSFCFTFKYV